ncbi:diguanylate cyclase [Oceanospirillum beijerinckii]|uniref:diguanylate cyclase n=1 Tax=Oceanospirillum beijerinckii TaxID=64976 RepID=UPI0003F5D799|nr:diguanylate cyclase [Oceanospirillum beijerinckii]MAC48585.1 hypothetical protein [Oceanospirillum sp.]
MRKVALFSKFKKLSLASGLLVAVFIGSLLVAYQITLVKKAVQQEGEFLSDIVFANLYAFMQKGWNKEDISKKLNELNNYHNGVNFHMHRSEKVIELFGARESRWKFTEAEAELLKGIGPDNRVSYRSEYGFIYSKPIEFQAECLACHGNAKAGDIAGVLSISYGFENLKLPLLHSFIMNMLLLILTVVATYLVYTRAIKASIIAPFDQFIDKMKSISQSDQIILKRSKTPIAEIAEIEDLILKEHSDLLNAFKKLKQASLIDPLTGLYNRKKLTEVLTEEITRFEQHSTPFSILSIDLNRFKPINDTYGHAVGDDALCHFGRIITEQLKGTDFAFRLGGDEFLALLPTTQLNEAQEIKGKVQQALAGTPLSIPQGELFLNASFGVCEMTAEDCFESLLNRADESMYQHKRELKANRLTDFSI